MSMDTVTEVCRLCPTTTNLVHVFDKRIVNDNMRDVVYVSTGVEILEKDIISQKVCAKCCNIALRMFKFRQDAAKHDILLKEKCSELLKGKEIKIPHTDIRIKGDVKVDQPSRKRAQSPPPKKVEENLVVKRKKDTHATEENSAVKRKKESAIEENSAVKPKKENPIHSSVANLFSMYPNLKIPTKSLKTDISPVVALKMGEVERYFKSRKLDMKKFIYYPKKTMAKKKTTSILTKESVQKLNKDEEPKARRHSESEESTKSRQSVKSSHHSESEKSNHKSSVRKSFGDIKIKLVEKAKKPSIEEKKHKSNAQAKQSDPPKLKLIASLDSKARETSPSVTQPKEPKTKLNKPEEHHPTSTDDSNKKSENLLPNLNHANLDASGNSLSLVDKSVPLFPCNYCSAIQYSSKGLKIHLTKHLVCHFCKAKFKTIDLKTEHIDKHCMIKKMMNDTSSYIPLKKVELSLKLRNKYPQAFLGFPNLPKSEVINVVKPNHIETTPIEDIADVIELLSDDEVDLPVALPSANKTPEPSLVQATAQVPDNFVPIEDSFLLESVSVVRPDVRIKGRDNGLFSKIENLGDDGKVIRNLLGLVNKRKSPTATEAMVQTELPMSKDIRVNQDLTCGFKELKEHLCVYKIPIHFKNGPFNVVYDYHVKQSNKEKNGDFSNLPIRNKVNINTNVTQSSVPPVTNTSPRFSISLPAQTAYPNKGAITTTIQNNIASLMRIMQVPASNISSNKSNASNNVPAAPVTTSPVQVPVPYAPVTQTLSNNSAFGVLVPNPPATIINKNASTPSSIINNSIPNNTSAGTYAPSLSPINKNISHNSTSAVAKIPGPSYSVGTASNNNASKKISPVNASTSAPSYSATNGMTNNNVSTAKDLPILVSTDQGPILPPATMQPCRATPSALNAIPALSAITPKPNIRVKSVWELQ